MIARNVLGGSLRAGRVEARARQRVGMREPLLLTDDDLERVNEIGSGNGVVLALLVRGFLGSGASA